MAPQQQKVLKTMSIVMLPLSTICSMFLPAGIQLYFFVTSALHYLQTFLMYTGWFRRMVGLRPLVKTVESAGPVSWQPPRVMDANAPRVKTAQAAVPKSETMFETIRSTINMAKEKMEDYSDRNDSDRARKAARDYEEKRALEEKEKYLARLQEKRMKDGKFH